MAFQLNQEFHTETFRAASVINAYAAVQLDLSTAYSVLPASGASNGVSPVYGLVQASAASVGLNVTVQTGGWGKAIAGASLGRGALVGVGIGTTSLVPLGGLGTASANPAQPQTSVGIALEPASAGTIFTVKIAPRQVV